MPRKIARPPGPDDWAAERIRYERERRGWSTAELARRLTMAGIPMWQQTVWKVESGEPRRRLSVGEASGFAQVFGISLAELMSPPDGVLERDLIDTTAAFAEWLREAGYLSGRLLDLSKQIDSQHDLLIEVGRRFPGFDPGKVSGPVVRQLSEIESLLTEVRTAIGDNDSAWSVIAVVTAGLLKDEITDSDSSEAGTDGSR